MGKRPNGHGGVSLHRASGRWRARLSVDGHELTRYAASQSEAWQALEAMRRRAADGLTVTSDRVTLADYLAGWLSDVAALRLRPGTLQGYEHHVRSYIAPTLGRVTMAQLSAGHVQRLIREMMAQGLAPASVQRVHATLRAALNHAVRQGLVTRNVAPLATLPTVRRQPPAAMEPAAAVAVLEAVKGHRLEALMTLAMFTGLRQGELAGLAWSDVDLTAGLLTVRRALAWHDGRPILAAPKTARSRRTMHVPALALEALRAHRERQRFEAKAAGPAWQNSEGLVFVTSTGEPLGKTVAWSALSACLRAAGLPHLRFHDLRHAYATLALQAGAGLREVQEGMGHTSITTTANVYAHVAPSTMRGVSDRLERLILDAKEGGG